MSVWQLSPRQLVTTAMDWRLIYHSGETVPLEWSHYMDCWRETILFLPSLKITVQQWGFQNIKQLGISSINSEQ